MATKKKGKKKGKVSKKAAVKNVNKKTGKKRVNKVRTGKVSKAKFPYGPFKDKKNIGNYAKNMILQGIATADIIARVLKKFPDSKINSTAVSYYRAALEKEDYDVPAAPKAS
jgi:hypothetical protein